MEKKVSRKPRVIKVVLLGNSGVGKSSLINRFISDRFNLNNEATVGAAYQQKTLEVNEQQVKLQIWDTAGQEKFRSLAPIYYRDCQVAILVYDITSRDSFEILQKWVDELQQHAQNDVVIAIVGNKADLKAQQQVFFNDVSTFNENINAVVKLTSAKDNKGVDELFGTIAEETLKKEVVEYQFTQENKTNYQIKRLQQSSKKQCCQ